MSKERKQEQGRLTQIAEFAKRETLRAGGHVPILLIEGTAGSLITQLAELPDGRKAKRMYMSALGTAAGQSGRAGSLKRLTFISEAWLSEALEKGLPDTPPSEDPNRKEVLIISSLRIRDHLVSTIV